MSSLEKNQKHGDNLEKGFYLMPKEVLWEEVNERWIEQRIKNRYLKYLKETKNYNLSLWNVKIEDIKNSKDTKEDKILQVIGNHKITLKNIYWLERKWKYMFIYLWNKSKSLIIDLENFEDQWTLENIEKSNQNSPRITELEKEVKNIFKAIDHVFYWNWFKLDETNIVKHSRFWKELKGKNLKQLRELLEFKQWELFKLYHIIWETKKQKEQYKRRLDFLVWVWDKYEAGASYFKLSEEEINNEVSKILLDQSINESLDYFILVHKKIDRNNRQSDIVEWAYKTFTKELWTQLFVKLKKDKATDEQFLRLAQIVTWKAKDHSKYYIDEDEKISWLKSDIDDNLRAPELANEILTFLMFKKEWIIERKILKAQNIKIEDEKVWNKKPSSIVKELLDRLDTIFDNKWRISLEMAWYSDVLNFKEESYESLSLEKKCKVSTLVRLLGKLKGKKKWYELYDKLVHWNEIELKKTGAYKEESWLTPNDLSTLFIEVSQDGFQSVIDGLNDNFDASILDWNWVDASDYDLEWIDKDIFDFYQEINWNGIFNLSDNSIENWKTTWKIGAVLWAVILSGIAFGAVLWTAWAVTLATVKWQILLWWVMWFTWTTTSVLLDSKWYETFYEWALDVWTDYIIWTGTWMLWGWLAYWISNKLRILDAKVFSKWWWINMWINLVDLGLLWFWAEIGRNILLEWHISEKRNKAIKLDK